MTYPNQTKEKNKFKTITVCWMCKNGDKQLFLLRDEIGRKTKDYMCKKCKDLHGIMYPKIGNQSYMRVQTK